MSSFVNCDDKTKRRRNMPGPVIRLHTVEKKGIEKILFIHSCQEIEL